MLGIKKVFDHKVKRNLIKIRIWIECTIYLEIYHLWFELL